MFHISCSDPANWLKNDATPCKVVHIFQTADCWKGGGEKRGEKGAKHLDPVAAVLCRKLTSDGVTRPWVQKFFVSRGNMSVAETIITA